ncbi:nuclear transport factor 2 family protein [Phenylobacterium sp.]|uniref:nuclear transport factor 2 family protein n=1 Tax=Phenylobacterium sp. TaxID=1871053 RepID=UPI00271B61C0|nr:nuclear transport factor 2 family protein [Phenylobacterium sp.]MDO8379263.1 nuclear transport factor 2 family protein [Phenylobacterium sp.]
MTPAETAIRARRKLTNKLIASHEAARLRPFLASDINLISGDGGLLVGIEAVLAAFEAQFRDASFVTYLRTTEAVRPDQEEARAAETGTWVATWRGSPTLTGIYLAVWKKVTGQWVIESELYVTLAAA